MGVVDVATEGLRQLERAARLLDVSSGVPKGSKTPVHKSLEQLFGEARGRSQPHSVLAAGSFGPGASRLLQGPQAQRLDREVADFALGPAAAGAGVGLAGEIAPEDQQNLGVSEFFGYRHEKVLLNAVEEAHRDCLRSVERHSSRRIQADWEEAKAQIMSTLAPQRLGPAAVSSALRGTAGGASNGGATTAAPPQDGAIIDLLLREPIGESLVKRIGQLSCESCPPYSAELAECWGIISQMLRPTPRAATCGALSYLQSRFAQEVQEAVFRTPDARLGGIPDAWSLTKAYGRLKFETSSFPSVTAHVWYAAFIAARAGFAHLLLELPDRAAPVADRCPLLRTVCTLMARRLQATAADGQPVEFTATSTADRADLLRANLADDSDGFHDVLVALLLGQSFALGRLPEGTVEDWLWFRLHSVHILAGDSQAPEFSEHLEGLQQHVLALPATHYDPGIGGAAGAQGLLAPAGMGAGGITQTLNFTKVLLLTGLFGRAVQQLRSQDRCLSGPALHVALVLHRAGSLQALSAPGQALHVASLVCDYAAGFACSDQLQYFRVLDVKDRAQALQRLLLRGSAGTSDELLGHLDPNGRHRPGLLERTLQEDGLGDHAEFTDLCATAGRTACERGQYREAIRLFHLGRCFTEVLQVLCRCLRLPLWREAVVAGPDEASLLSQDIQRFFAIYERNLERYAITPQAWAVARKLYAARMFRSLCERGQPEAALDIFEREQLLPLSAEPTLSQEVEAEMACEYPRIVADYVQILRHAASQGAVANAALQARVRQLQSFLAVRSQSFSLDQETATALAGLALF